MSDVVFGFQFPLNAHILNALAIGPNVPANSGKAVLAYHQLSGQGGIWLCCAMIRDLENIRLVRPPNSISQYLP
jgi:hypothetical protein